MLAAEPGARIRVIVSLVEKANIGSVRSRDRRARRAQIVRTLKSHADLRQAPLIAELRNSGARQIKPLWLIGAVAATVPASAVRGLSNVPGVAEIRLDETITAPVVNPAAITPPEWNIDAIGAPNVWTLGATGQGAVVANLDTGVDNQHPDLASRWRGGANSWFDPNGEYATPHDSDGHGTLTMGLMVGGDAGGTAIGVAPDATWIAAKIFNSAGDASLSGIHQSFQWVLDPDGNPGTDDAPDVVNNSWGFGSSPGACDLEFEQDIATLKAAGIAVVFSAGNNGPFSATAESPANNPSAFAVGAVDDALTVADFSSRGPSPCDGTPFPEIVAPGVLVNSTDLSFGGFPFYYPGTGTSFAAPHISGAVALLRSAFPDATVEELESAMKISAQDGGAAGIDDDYGYGVVDVSAAHAVLDNAGSNDADQDGFVTSLDCDDTDATIYPGATEIKHDGIDQDCNGHDLTIEIIRADYIASVDRLIVEATSALQGSANLSVVGYGPMRWRSRRGKWSLSATPPNGNPGSVIVSGVEGAETAFIGGAPPVAANDGYSIAEGGTLTVPASGILGNDSDPDGDVLTAVLVSGPGNGVLSLDPANGSFTYTPNPGFSGTDSFTYRVSDGALESNIATVTISVTPVNDAPVAANDGYSIAEGQTLTVPANGVLGNDNDPDGDALTAALVSSPADGVLNLNQTDGSFTYVPNPGFSGTDTFTYRASDGALDSNLATVTITVTAVNEAPVASDDGYSIAEGQTLTVPANGVLGNDNDPDGDALTAALVSSPADGVLNLNQTDGSFTYVPNPGFSGTDTFTYKASDGALDSNIATVTIIVTPVNGAPVASDDGYSIAEDGTLTVPANGVLENDSDPDGDPLTAVLVSGTGNGVISLDQAKGSFTYTPNPGYSGIDSFTYRASDGTLESNLATVTVTVTPVNGAPVAANDSYSVAEGGTLTVPANGVLGNDSDPNGDPLTAVLVSGPGNGILSFDQANGSFTYGPNPGFSGTDTFTYRASDGALDSNIATVTIIVTPVNDAPIAVNDTVSMPVRSRTTIDLVANDFDNDGTIVPGTVTIVTGPTKGRLRNNGNGTVLYAPSFPGTATFTYTVNDNLGAISNLATVHVTITP